MKHKFVYILTMVGALGVAMIVGWAASEAGMDCQDHKLLKTGEQYTVCYRR